MAEREPIDLNAIDYAGIAEAIANAPKPPEWFTTRVNNTGGDDGTPGWAYDDRGCCACCGNLTWEPHVPGCHLRAALDALAREKTSVVVGASRWSRGPAGRPVYVDEPPEQEESP